MSLCSKGPISNVGLNPHATTNFLGEQIELPVYIRTAPPLTRGRGGI